MTDPTYLEPDRGLFRAFNLDTPQGKIPIAHCRFTRIAVFNYLSAFRYGIAGYQVQWWPEGTPTPWHGGTGYTYAPKDRSTYTTLYARVHPKLATDLAALEKACISDFLKTKLTSNPLSWEDFLAASLRQRNAVGQLSNVPSKGMAYKNGLHATVYTATATTPLALDRQWLEYQGWNLNDRGLLINPLRYKQPGVEGKLTLDNLAYQGPLETIETLIADYLAKYQETA